MEVCLTMTQLTKLQLSDALVEEFRNSQATAAWTDPTTGKVYMHHSGDITKFPFADRQRFVMDTKAMNKFIELKDEGKLSESEYQDKINFAIWNSKDGWDEKAKIWLASKNTAVAEDVQGIKPSDYSGMENVVIEGIIYGLNERVRVAQNALRTVQVQGTIRKYPELTSRLTVNRNIDFTQDIPVKSVGLKSTQIELKCDAMHFAIYDHANWRPHQVDLLRTNIEAIGFAFIRDKADQVVTLLTDTAITAITGTDWGVSTNNPYLDFAKAQKAINDNNGVADKAMLNEIARAVIRGNPNAKTTMDTSRVDQSGSKVVVGDVFINGYTTYIENGFGNTLLVVWDNEAVEWDQGPEGTVNYREDRRFRTGYIRFTWNKPLIIDLGKIRRVTGITTVP